MMLLRSVLLTFTVVVTSTPPAHAATGCPDVDAAQEMLAKAASNENSRALEASRKQGESPPEKQGAAGPPPETSRAAALVKQAATACAAGDKTAASEKARAAIALLQKK